MCHLFEVEAVYDFTERLAGEETTTQVYFPGVIASLLRVQGLHKLFKLKWVLRQASLAAAHLIQLKKLLTSEEGLTRFNHFNGFPGVFLLINHYGLG